MCTSIYQSIYHAVLSVYLDTNDYNRLGEDVPFIRRARIGVVQGSISELFSPNHCSVETSSLDDLSKQYLITKVNAVTFIAWLHNNHVLYVIRVTLYYIIIVHIYKSNIIQLFIFIIII